MDRRGFVVRLGGMLVLVACDGGGDDDDVVSPTPVTCAGTGAQALSITGNHGHAVGISQGDMTAGTTQTYSIQGSAIHDHTITVTAAHFTTLLAGETVSVGSTSDGTHSHTVTLRCIAA